MNEPKSDDGIFFANGAFGIMASGLGRGESMHDGQPHDRLGFEFEPFEKMAQVDLVDTFGLFVFCF